MPKNALQRIRDKEDETAWLDGFFYGYQVSVLLTQAEADAQSLINKSDPWLVRLFKKDPGSVDAIMQRLAALLDAIPEPPHYEDEYSAMLSADGYASGSKRGAAEVEATLVLIEAGAVIAEVALMEIAMGPLGGANALRAAVMRLRHLPIFIPGAAGGLGGFVKLAKATHTATRHSSKKLAAAMARVGILRPAGHEAHHIVAGEHRWAQKARDILAKFDIKIDDAVNGVFLPATKNSPNPLGSTVHRPLTNMEAYYDAVNEALRPLKTKAEVVAKLRKIAQELTNGTFL